MEQTALDSGFAMSLCSENDNARKYGDLTTNYKPILDSQLELELELELKKLIKLYADQQIRNSYGKELLQTDLHYDLCGKCEKLKQHSIGSSMHCQSSRSQISHHLNLGNYKYQKLQCGKDEKHLSVNAYNELGLSNKQYHFEDLKHHFAEKDRNFLDLEMCLAARRWHLNETSTIDKISKLTFEECKLQNDNLDSKQKAEFNHQNTPFCTYKITLANTNFDNAIVEMGVQLQYQKHLVKGKEEEIEHLQQYFRNCLEIEQNLDNVHELSLDYNHSIHQKTSELISLKSKQQILEDNVTVLLQLRCENLHQTKANKVTDNVNYRFDLLNLKANYDAQQEELRELHLQTEALMKHKDDNSQQLLGIKSDLKYLNNELKTSRKQYEFIKDLCETTRVQLQLIEGDSSSSKYKIKQLHSESDNMRQLRNEFQMYVKKTFSLADKLDSIQHNLQQVMHENQVLKSYHSFARYQKQNEGYRIQNNAVEETSDENCDNLMDANPSSGQSKAKALAPESSLLPFIETESCQSNTSQQIPDKRPSMYSTRSPITNELTFIRFEELLKENEILKQQVFDKTIKITEFELNTDIQENIFKCKKFEKLLLEQQQIIQKFRKQLLINDSKLYKMEKHTPNETSDCSDMQTMQADNQRLKQELQHQINLKIQYQNQLQQEQIVVAKLQMRLNALIRRRVFVETTASQTDLPLCDNQINELKANVTALELSLGSFHESDAIHKKERLKLLKKLVEVQDSKILFMQQNQKDWEDIMSSLQEAQTKEEHLRHELELKRMELEHLNEIFAEQNRELKKFEKFAIALENKRQLENQIMHQSFHNKIHVLQQQLVYLNEQLIARQDKDKAKDADEDKNINKNPNEDSSMNSLIQTSSTKQPEIIQRLESIRAKLKQIKEFNLAKQITAQLASTCADIHNQSESVKNDNLDAKQSGNTDDHLCPHAIMHAMPNDDKPKECKFDQLFASLIDNVEILLTSLDSGVALNLSDKMFSVNDFHRLTGQAATTSTRNVYDANAVGNLSATQNGDHKTTNLMDDYKQLQRATANSINTSILDDSYVSTEGIGHSSVPHVEN